MLQGYVATSCSGYLDCFEPLNRETVLYTPVYVVLYYGQCCVYSRSGAAQGATPAMAHQLNLLSQLQM